MIFTTLDRDSSRCSSASPSAGNYGSPAGVYSMHSQMSIIMWIGSLGLFLGLAIVPVSICQSLPKTQKKLNESATMSCDEPCPGVMQWRRQGKGVAECGPVSEPGFLCRRHEGKAVLSVPRVNFSTRGYYSVYCDGKEIGNCRQLLHLIPPEDDVELDAGDHLEMDLHIPKPVIIQFSRPGNTSTVQLCRVIGRLHQCVPEYQGRVRTVGNVFVLLEMMPSDSGNYSVREEDLTLVSSLNITVKERSSSVKKPTSPETENRDPKHIFISTVNDIQESGIWRDGYQKGSNDGYLKGTRDGALTAGLVAGLVGVISAFLLGVFVGPKVRPLLISCVQKLGAGHCSHENQPEDKEKGVPLTSDSASQSSAE